MNNTSQILIDIEQRMGTDQDDSIIIYKALMKIANNDVNLVKEILQREKWCNYYLDTNNYYELSCHLVNDDCLWGDSNEDDEFYQFLLIQSEEETLQRRLKPGGWFVSNGIGICLDDDIVEKIPQ